MLVPRLCSRHGRKAGRKNGIFSRQGNQQVQGSSGPGSAEDLPGGGQS
jgi:hypothetical protein